MAEYKGADLTAAITAVLEATTLPVGEGVKPEGAGWQGTPGDSQFVTYVVVHPSPGGVFEGSLDEPYDDGQPDYVITAYAATQHGCQVAADLVYEALVTSEYAVTGRSVQLASPDVEGGVVRDDDVQPPVFYSPTRWRFYTTAA